MHFSFFSISGILSPYEINGKIYTVTVILNHFPTDILQGQCDYLIGVYVSPIQKLKKDFY
jgi:NTE family protein